MPVTYPSFLILKTAVLILGVSTLAFALAIYLLMEIHYRRQLSRQVRRVMLESQLLTIPAQGVSEVFRSTSNQQDRKIILGILVDQAAWGDVQWQNAVRQMVAGTGILDRWLADLRGGSVVRRVRAATYLGSIRDPSVTGALVGAAEDHSRLVLLAVAISLGRLREPRGVEGLIRIARHLSRSVPDLTLAAALAACAETQPALLVELLHARESRLRIIASWALSEIADRSVLQPLLEITEDPDPEVRAKSARALARLHEPESVEALSCLARDPVWFVRIRALDALGQLGEVAGETAALRGLEDSSREVRARAAFALRKIRGMKGEVAAQVLANASRRGFNSLLSEWDRNGFLWELVKGLSIGNPERYYESVKTVRMLIEAEMIHALANFILVFPDLKVRLRLVRLFGESESAGVIAEVNAIARSPACHRLVARKIAREFPATP